MAAGENTSNQYRYFFQASVFDGSEIVVGLPELGTPKEVEERVWSAVARCIVDNRLVNITGVNIIDDSLEPPLEGFSQVAIVPWAEARRLCSSQPNGLEVVLDHDADIAACVTLGHIPEANYLPQAPKIFPHYQPPHPELDLQW